MNMTNKEKVLLNKHLSTATNYLEFGSGESTVTAYNTESIKHITCVESSLEFIDTFLRDNGVTHTPEDKLTLQIPTLGKIKMWGYPVSTTPSEDWRSYTSFQDTFNADVVLVDGRFRVACLLSVLLQTEKDVDPTIMFHDFWTRKQYHVVLPFVDIVEIEGQLVVMTPRKDIDIELVRSLYESYVLNPE